MPNPLPLLLTVATEARSIPAYLDGLSMGYYSAVPQYPQHTIVLRGSLRYINKTGIHAHLLTLRQILAVAPQAEAVLREIDACLALLPLDLRQVYRSPAQLARTLSELNLRFQALAEAVCIIIQFYTK